jgi:hypothetical protein
LCRNERGKKKMICENGKREKRENKAKLTVKVVDSAELAK